MPTYAYQIGDYTVTKEGDLEAEKLDFTLIRQLAADGLIIYEETEDAMEDREVTEAYISFPIEQYSGVSLRNMLNLIHSRGKLLTKATRHEFSVADGLIEALKDDACTASVEAFLQTVAAYEDEHGKSICGITMTPEMLTFTGLSHTDATHIHAYMELAALMNTQAITQKRIQSKVVTEENEKNAMRTWLIRIGMNGEAYKAARRILMENLSGHTAFRTQEDAERFSARVKEKRESAKVQISG